MEKTYPEKDGIRHRDVNQNMVELSTKVSVPKEHPIHSNQPKYNETRNWVEKSFPESKASRYVTEDLNKDEFLSPKHGKDGIHNGMIVSDSADKNADSDNTEDVDKDKNEYNNEDFFITRTDKDDTYDGMIVRDTLKQYEDINH